MLRVKRIQLKTRVALAIGLLLTLVAVSHPLFPQMPGWATITDSDGNRYFIDQNFKIHVSGEIESKNKPVSIDGLEYYVAQGEELIRKHHPAEGLYLLKGVKLLADNDPRAGTAGMKASKRIIELSHREKDRYQIIDHESALVLVRLGDSVHAYNDWMGYQVKVTGDFTLLSRKTAERHNYARDGAGLGIRFPESRDRNFDAILSVNAELFHYNLSSHTTFEQIWQNKNGNDGFTREVISENESEVFYRFSGGSPARYAGFERFMVRGARGVHVRILVPEERMGALQENIRTVINSFALQGSR
jgi:hypothetical protein